mgnify:CR=1 FL=1
MGKTNENFASHKIGEGVAGKTLEKGKTIWGDDLRKLSWGKPERSDLRSYMSVPIGKLGVFQAASTSSGAFSQVDVELAEILAGHLNEELKRLRLEARLIQQAIRDPLTGLYNRRYFNETLSKEVEKSKRYRKPIAFLMIDVNRFKEINDKYSHQIGDKVLREVASLLQNNVRKADTVVRYGGDEFLIMMPETNGESKSSISRLKDSLIAWNEDSDLLNFPLTLAMGVSYWRPDQKRDIEEALKEADSNMYKEKKKI